MYVEATTTRASGIAQGMATFLAGFATVELATQVAQRHQVDTTKTWVAGPNARPEHAALSGVTVPVAEDFPNGEPWPGGAPGCNCHLVISS